MTTTTLAFAAPILPGKTDAWKALVADLNGAKKSEYLSSRKRLGAVREQCFLQQTPQGDMVVVVIEAEDAQNVLRRMGESTDPFDVWFCKAVSEIHGFDMSTPMPAPSALLLDQRF